MLRVSEAADSLEDVRKLVRQGAEGDKKAVSRAYEKLSKLREAKPGDALIEAYYGSVMALAGRDAVKPLDKAEKAQEGLNALHRAVELNPGMTEIRLLRGQVCLRLPESFFHCADFAIEDFTFLLNRCLKDPKSLSRKQAKEAIKSLQFAYEQAGKPEEARKVQKRYDTLLERKKK